MAVLHAALHETSSLEVRTDSQYVERGFQRLRRDGLEAMMSHRDLWARLEDNLSSRSTPIRVTKVLGHAKWSDVHRGRETAQNKVGNHQADRLATEGAKRHRNSHALGALFEQNRQRCAL